MKALRSCLIAAAVFCVSGLVAGQPPAPPDGWTDSFVMVNGIRMHYWRTGGEKPALVLSHGSSDDGLCWTVVAKELSGDYDVIMPDARGHGLSDPPTDQDSADAQAEDLASLIQALGLKNPIVMGHSMGSSSTAWFAAKYPETPRAVILEDPGLAPRAWRSGATTSPEAAMKRARAQILERNQTSYDDLVAQCMEESPSWGREECRIWATSKRLHHPNNAFRYGAGRQRPPMSELLSRISVPTLILKADDDAETRKANEEVSGALQYGRLVHIDGAGHNVRREQKESFLRELRTFLADLDR